MVTDLLATKLLIPPLARRTIARPVLQSALDEGIPTSRLTLVTAPAGYGKTTLLAQWARETELPVAWYTASEADNDPARFLRYLYRAWQSVQPGVAESRLGILLSGSSPPIDEVLMAFVNVAADAPGQLVFVIDDVQALTDPEVGSALATLLDNLPPAMHVVIAGRAHPQLPIARYRARRELLEIRASELRFGAEESARFLDEVMDVHLDVSIIASINEQVEGWVTGLQLAALAPQHHVDQLGTSRHHIADYLGEEVLAQLPEETRQFLLETCILDRFTVDLCDYVRANSDSRATLDHLVQGNLFIVPLDDNRTWFRYHRVFAEALREYLRRLPADFSRNLERKAAEWFLAHDFPESAFRHAIAGQHPDLASQVIERYSTVKLFSGEMRVVQRWLEAIPDEWLAANPEIVVAQAAYLLLNGQPNACLQRLGDLDHLPQGAPAMTRASARATGIRCFAACFGNDLESAERYAGQALRDLPADDIAFRADIYHALGESYRNHGRWDDARAHYLKVLDLARTVPNNPTIRCLTIHVHGALADLELRLGHLHKAGASWKRALGAIEDPHRWGEFPLPLSGWIRLRLGELFHEWNDLTNARTYVITGLERSELGGDPLAMIAGMVILSRLELADGSFDTADQYLTRAAAMLDEAPLPAWTSRFEHDRVDLWLAKGQIRPALDWASRTLADHSLNSRPEPEAAWLAIARVLIQQGDPDALTKADGVLDKVAAVATDFGLMGVAIEAHVLRALAHERRKDRVAALSALGNALRMAEPEGYIRLFVRFGNPMIRLLQELRSRGVLPEYVSRILAASGATLAGDASVLVEPLSDRETTVLRLIANGLTNREIAELLFVSPETIKKHTGNIYGKLGVHGRVEAVSMARKHAIIE